MQHKLLIIMALCLSMLASKSFANDVVKWVDEHGVTHFGNAQFAPPGSGESVMVEDANAMDAPDVGILSRREGRSRANITVLERSKLQNPRGWRGFSRRSRGGDYRR